MKNVAKAMFVLGGVGNRSVEKRPVMNARKVIIVWKSL